MCDDDIHPGLVEDWTVSRRTFGIAGLATAGLAAAARAETQPLTHSKDVEIKTADGTCDAVLIHPVGKGAHPAVLIWPDIMGLRPVFRSMGTRLAGLGYTVLVVNPFYRSKKAPVMEGEINFGDPEVRKVLFAYRGAMTNDGIDSDSKAFIGFLDAQKATNTRKKAGVQGYCMGGALSFRTAAAVPNRIGAVGSFHGGNGLVTKTPDSPHLLIPRTKAEFLVCQAQNDDKQNPAMKDELKAAFDAAKVPATVEVYPAAHGWCVPGSQVYDAAAAEKAWANLASLYQRRLV